MVKEYCITIQRHWHGKAVLSQLLGSYVKHVLHTSRISNDVRVLYNDTETLMVRPGAYPAFFQRYAHPPNQYSRFGPLMNYFVSRENVIGWRGKNLFILSQVAQARNMSIGKHRHLLRNIQNIRICMGKKPIVSVTYENERISIKNSLPYLKCVFCRICICCIKRFTKVGHSSEAARLIHRRKTAVNSLQ